MPSVSLFLEQTTAFLAPFELGKLTSALSYSAGVLKSLRPLRVLSTAGLAAISVATTDPCQLIAGQKWVAPAQVRECYSSFAVDAAEKILEVVAKTLNFHTSVNYAIQAPPPFENDVKVDLINQLARIGETTYESDYAFHVDLSHSVRAVNDGHCTYINYCYDSLFVNHIPLPLVLLTDAAGIQRVHIAPDAFVMASAYFPDQLQLWQDALPGDLNGQLESLSGARVVTINGEDPWNAVNNHAAVAGGYQGLGTRQNGLFSSYQVQELGWAYLLGDFAQQALPLDDSVTMTVERIVDPKTVTFTLPYRAVFTGSNFQDSPSLRAQHCRAGNQTNGKDLNGRNPLSEDEDEEMFAFSAAARFQQAAPVSKAVARRMPMGVMLDVKPRSTIPLPRPQWPDSTVEALEAAPAVAAQFFSLNDGQTGVLALGSFSAEGPGGFHKLQFVLLDGLKKLRRNGRTRLIIDVSNNGGGFICIAHWLHRIIAGPRASTEPQPGLDTKARAGPLAQRIVNRIVQDGVDPYGRLMYRPDNHHFANGTKMPLDYDWLETPVETVVNGKRDAFSQRLGRECMPFSMKPPALPLFDPKDVVIVSNGRCASSCSLFSVAMAKHYGTRTVVVGGKQDVPQQYCGVVGGQASDFSTMDDEVKTTGLKQHGLAPPDFITNSVQGIVWRLAFGIKDADEPEEWQDHPADVKLPLTAEIVNKPAEIWKAVAAQMFT